jgi:tRNA modification GTPase
VTGVGGRFGFALGQRPHWLAPMPDFTETIAALATPVGTSALAVVRVSGPDTARIVAQLDARPPLPRTVRRTDYRCESGEVLDDVLLVFYRNPSSYTGEDSLEISCHGNPYIARRILEDLYSRGCRPAEPGEFTQRAFLNGRMDLSQAEAVMDLIHARSDRAIAAANLQLRGALGRRMKDLMDGLLHVLARVEAYIDFPEEDLPAEDSDLVAGEVSRLLKETDRLLATSRYGEILRGGVKTVIVGRPNVGKSSLLNRLVGKDRAIVSSEPGTTRDFLEEQIIVGPHSLRLIDTAGLNPSPAPLEKLGMEKTAELVAEADLLLLLTEAGSRLDFPEALAPVVGSGRCVIVLTKSDLSHNHPAIPDGVSWVRVSAITGDGIEQLQKAIVAMVDRLGGPEAENVITINARHAHALQTAVAALRAAQDSLRLQRPVELLASDLRVALGAFGEIGGRVDNEQMLDVLFASFCIGK